jgi:hypothetical protein
MRRWSEGSSRAASATRSRHPEVLAVKKGEHLRMTAEFVAGSEG